MAPAPKNKNNAQPAASTAAAAAAAPAAPAAPTSNGGADEAAGSPSPSPSASPSSSSAIDIVKTGGGKPDQTHHYAQLDALKEDIAKTQAELDNVRSILNGTGPSKDTPEGKRRDALKTELDEIRNKQAGSKGSRGKVLDQVKALQDSTTKRIKDLNAAKAKLQFKSAADVDAQISRLNGQIESGTMKLVDERRAINEISNLRKAKKTYDQLEVQQTSIDNDRKQIDELRKTLDDPESRGLSKRYDDIKAELDSIAKETEKQVGSRSKLLDQRTALSKKLNELNQTRRDRQAAYRAENEKFHAKVQAEREKRNERFRAEREASADAKRKEHEQQLREDAALPAFAKEIEDCDVLLNYFNTKAGLSAPSAPPSSSAGPSGSSSSGAGFGKPLEARQVQSSDDTLKGMRVAKKKGEEDESDYFFSGAGKKGKGGKGAAKGSKQPAPAAVSSANGTAAAADSSASASTGTGSTLHVPLGHLSALLALSIPPPTSTADLPRVIDNLKLKKSYFVGNSERVTKENVAKVEKMLGGKGKGGKGGEAVAEVGTEEDTKEKKAVVEVAEKEEEEEEEEEKANGTAAEVPEASSEAVEDAEEKVAVTEEEEKKDTKEEEEEADEDKDEEAEKEDEEEKEEEETKETAVEEEEEKTEAVAAPVEADEVAEVKKEDKEDKEAVKTNGKADDDDDDDE